MLKKSLQKVRSILRPVSILPTAPQALINLLRDSGKFKAQWYLQQYPDVAANKHWRKQPEAHYLLQGAALGYNPSPWFDTNWYLAQYTDVARAAINPLVHYIRYGAAEGRLPNGRKGTVKAKGYLAAPVSDIRDRLALHLWGGLSGPALQALQCAYENSSLPARECWSACWHASRWYYFTGDYNKTLELGNLLLQLDPSQALRKEGVLLRAFCLNELGRHNAAKAELQAYIEANPNDADGYFTLANACIDNDDMRLSLINKALGIHGYAPIALADVTAPLTLANITASAPVKLNGTAKVSIIMPVYCAEAHLHIAVNSLLNQSWQNFEIIIVDDCSPDGTFALAQQLAAQDSRIIALRQLVNAGAYAARNAGLKIASGDFITTHDSDDWSHPQKLETQLNYFEQHSHIMGICTHWIRVRSNMIFTQNWRPNNALIHWSQSSFMFKRQVLIELGGWDEVRVGGDTEFIWRVKARYGQQGYAQIMKDVPLAFALDDQSSLTRTKATHVRTVYFGLRHIYREICAWWHRTADDLHIEHQQSRKALPIPVAMQFRDGRSTKVDVLLVSDFTNDEMSAPLLNWVAENPQVQFGLMHWPDFNVLPGRLSELYFNAIATAGALPVAAGEQLLTKHIVIAALQLLQHPVDAIPELLEQPKCWLVAADNFKANAIPKSLLLGDVTLGCLSELQTLLELA